VKIDSAGADPIPSPWWKTRQAALYAQCSAKLLYREIAAGRLRAARLGSRRDLRFSKEWLDDWLTASATPIEIGRR
jgi:excisionase family DNA binding protein